jgi:hypothetical protein
MDDDEYRELLLRHEPLIPALKPYLSERTLCHPLVKEFGVDSERAALQNRIYRWKCAAVKAALDERDMQKYILLHERAYRLGAFCFIADRVDDRHYWELLSDVWEDSNNIWQNRAAWRAVWKSERPMKRFAMRDEERRRFDDLDDLITVYRGQPPRPRTREMSWTLDRDVAVWFAKRWSRNGGFLLTGTVAKADIHAFKNGRQELEIVAGKVTAVSTKDVAASSIRRPEARSG